MRHFLVAHALQARVDALGRHARHAAQLHQVAFGQRGVGRLAEAAQRAVHAAVGQHDGGGKVRAHTKRRGRQLRKRRVRGRVVHQLRQAAVQHALAERFFQRGPAAGGNQFAAGLGVHVLEQAMAVAYFGQEDHVHVEVRAQLVQHFAHGVVDQRVAARGGGDQQLADVRFQRVGGVVPQVQAHGDQAVVLAGIAAPERRAQAVGRLSVPRRLRRSFRRRYAVIVPGFLAKSTDSARHTCADSY